MASGMGPQRSPQAQRLQTSPQQQARQRRVQNMYIANLPRFHPANYSSTSTQQPDPSNGPLLASKQREPPQQQSQMQRSEAQRQLYLHQRELMSMTRPPRSPSFRSSNPSSPHLLPLGSPGPVTPLELEEKDSYFVTGATSPALSEKNKDDPLEAFIENDVRGQNEFAASSTKHGLRPPRSPVQSHGHRHTSSRGSIM